MNGEELKFKTEKDLELSKITNELKEKVDLLPQIKSESAYYCKTIEDFKIIVDWYSYKKRRYVESHSDFVLANCYSYDDYKGPDWYFFMEENNEYFHEYWVESLTEQKTDFERHLQKFKNITSSRLTRKRDSYECRCGNCDEIQEWVENLGGKTGDMCDNCPIMDSMNRLAEFEDKEEESMRKIDGLTFKDSEVLYDILLADENFKYDAGEGGFITPDGVCVGIDRSPYQCCLYALSDVGKKSLNKWHNYIVKKWNHKQSLESDIDFMNADDVLNRIVKIVKNEQSATSCEYTKLKSFEMIESIVNQYLCREEN